MESSRDAGLLEYVLEPLNRRRTAVVAAQPGDETIGAGALLSRFEDLYVLHVTDGVPRAERFGPTGAEEASRQEHAQARRQEALDALALAGVPEARIGSLGISEHETANQLGLLTWTLIEFDDHYRPELVLTHPYEGRHPDHDACAFAVHAAVELLLTRIEWAPVVVEMSAYCGPGGRLAMGDFLANGHAAIAMPLDEEEAARKRQMLRCFISRRQALKSFRATPERFRVAPRYDFTRPPHAGILDYELLGAEVTGERFRRLAAAAWRDLGLGEPEAVTVM